MGLRVHGIEKDQCGKWKDRGAHVICIEWGLQWITTNRVTKWLVPLSAFAVLSVTRKRSHTESWRNFTQESNMIWFTFLKVHSSCYIKTDGGRTWKEPVRPLKWPRPEAMEAKVSVIIAETERNRQIEVLFIPYFFMYM